MVHARSDYPHVIEQSVTAAFAAEAGVAHDIVALNAGAALYVSGQAKNIPDGIEKARAVMHSGAASAKMRQFIDATRTLGGR